MHFVDVRQYVQSRPNRLRASQSRTLGRQSRAVETSKMRDNNDKRTRFVVVFERAMPFVAVATELLHCAFVRRRNDSLRSSRLRRRARRGDERENRALAHRTKERARRFQINSSMKKNNNNKFVLIKESIVFRIQWSPCKLCSSMRS